MAESATPKIAPSAKNLPENLHNTAVSRCCKAWNRAWNASMAHENREFTAALDAGAACRDATPSLSGEQNIRDFIACAGHGILFGAIEEKCPPSFSTPLRSCPAPSPAPPDPTPPYPSRKRKVGLWNRGAVCNLHTLH
jgi:hypothetical protein